MNPAQYEQEFLRALLQAQPVPPPRCDAGEQLDIWSCLVEIAESESGGEQA